MSRSTHLLLIRHGEVEASYHHIFGGRIDMYLSPRGEEQARRMADYLRGRPVDALYVSPMKRARATAVPLAEAMKLQVEVVDTLHEVDFGDWTGLHWDEIEPKYGVSAFAWLDEFTAGRIPNAEPPAAYAARVDRGLQRVLQEQAGRTAVIVCHGGVIRMLMALLLRLPLAEMAKFQIEYASLTRANRVGERTELELVNFTPWRDLP
jgi:broad specificity phosphatase PhoE